MKFPKTGNLAVCILGLLCLLPVATLYGGQSVYAPSPFDNSSYTRVEGLEVHYRLWEPEKQQVVGHVLLVHGFGGSTYSWEQTAQQLRSLGYRVVAVDVPPFGYSDRAPRQNQSFGARAKLLNTFLSQRFPQKKWHLAGHSMGGAVVQAMALQYPENYISVCFVAAALFRQVEVQKTSAPGWLRMPGVTFFLGSLAESWLITPSRIEALLLSAYAQPVRPEQIEAYRTPLVIPGTARAILNSVEYSREIFDLCATQLRIPSIAIWGAQDNWVPLESRKSIMEQIPGLQLEVIEEAGHNPMETHLEEFLERWLRFLDNL